MSDDDEKPLLPADGHHFVAPKVRRRHKKERRHKKKHHRPKDEDTDNLMFGIDLDYVFMYCKRNWCVVALTVAVLGIAALLLYMQWLRPGPPETPSPAHSGPARIVTAPAFVSNMAKKQLTYQFSEPLYADEQADPVGEDPVGDPKDPGLPPARFVFEHPRQGKLAALSGDVADYAFCCEVLELSSSGAGTPDEKVMHVVYRHLCNNGDRIQCYLDGVSGRIRGYVEIDRDPENDPDAVSYTVRCRFEWMFAHS